MFHLEEDGVPINIYKISYLINLSDLNFTYLEVANTIFSTIVNEEGSNVSIMPPLFKFLITQNLKLKYQNKFIRFDLYYIFF
jgi:hypothetical protein